MKGSQPMAGVLELDDLQVSSSPKHFMFVGTGKDGSLTFATTDISTKFQFELLAEVILYLSRLAHLG